MDIWFTITSVFYVLICMFLILVVLLQQGKGGGMGSAFGGGGSQTVFGGAGAGNFLTRLTAICATLFMVLSALLAYLSSSGDRALETAQAVEDEAAAEAEEETVGAEGATGEEAPPPALPVELPSRDTPEEAEEDPVIDALEQDVENAVQPPAAEEPAEPPPAAEEPAAEEPAPPPPEAEAPRSPTKVRPARQPRPRPAAEEPSGEAPPAQEAPPAAEDPPADG
jgi:preprotein translocase subunit SecG